MEGNSDPLINTSLMHAEIKLEPIIRKIEQIRREMIRQEERMEPIIRQLPENFQNSARNLTHYLTLRLFDLRPVQESLSTLGLSSIGHSERYPLTNVTNILHLLHLLQGKEKDAIQTLGLGFSLSFPRGKQRLLRHTEELFGPQKHPGHTRIMVTLPTEAADDYELIRDFLLEGVEILRINCSHDGPEVWEKMIQHKKRAVAETGNECLIYMDLAGPKLRTGPIKSKNRDTDKKGPYIRLFKGDTLLVTRKEKKGYSAHIDSEGLETRPALISTTLPKVFDFVKTGEMVWFDDGEIGGIIEDISNDTWTVTITHARIKGEKLRADKGINLPDSDLRLPSLTKFDLKTLPFIAQHADMVGYSFVQSPEDVERLQEELLKLGRTDIGIILKIETKKSFDHMPSLMFAGMKWSKLGVMIARGDLAVEVGWDRFAEVQEQISWLCEAAQIPYIWATQILESLAKKGIATRAEITDASMAARAECAMLNKGPYIMEAIQTLKSIDQRMEAHHEKKMGSLRPLNVARQFFDSMEKATKEVPEQA